MAALATVRSQQLAGDFMERLRLRKEFEENFTRTLRDLRKELEQVLLVLAGEGAHSLHPTALTNDLTIIPPQTSLKEVDGKNRFRVGVRNLIQISNERIDKVLLSWFESVRSDLADPSRRSWRMRP